MTDTKINQTRELTGIVEKEDTIPLSDLPSDVSSPIPQMKFTTRTKPRSGIASDCKQLVILVDDISGSMAGAKAHEAHEANQTFGNTLADPVNKNGFILSVIHFNHEAHVVVVPELATTAILPPFVPSGSTNFDVALKKAIEVGTEFICRDNSEGWDYQRIQVLFLSDGHSTVEQKNIDALHEIADVTAIAYGTDADKSTLRRIASDGQVHVIGTNGSELREFLANVGKTLSQELATAR